MVRDTARHSGECIDAYLVLDLVLDRSLCIAACLLLDRSLCIDAYLVLDLVLDRTLCIAACLVLDRSLWTRFLDGSTAMFAC